MVASDTNRNTVIHFLSTGKVEQAKLNDIIAAADSLVRTETQTAAKNAVKLGRQFIKHAKPLDGRYYLTALRSSGWAELVSGNYKEALAAYSTARDLKEADTSLKASIDRVLIDIHMYLDNYAEAEQAARRSLKTFRRKKALAEIAKTNVNFGNLLHRQDRHQEANKLYREAAAYFESVKNDFATALCWYNQGNTEVQLFNFKTADRLFTDARAIFKRIEQPLYAIGCLYGLAWLHMLQGDFHIALRELTECEQFYKSGNHPRELVLCKLDRAESNLGLNLFLDARDAADEGSKAARKIGLTYEAAKGELFSGKANFALGHTRVARNKLKKAAEGFKAAHNEGFLAATTLTLAQLDRAETGQLDQIRSASDRFSRAQLPLWEAICDLQIIADWPEETAPIKRLATNKAARTVPHLAARRLTLLGDREARRGRQSAAVANWEKAADILDAVRAKLPPIDMRSSFFQAHSEPHQRLVEAEHENQPLTAATWSERFKTVGLWGNPDQQLLANPARERVRQSLTELAGQVSAISGLVGHAEGDRDALARIPRIHRPLHRKVRLELSELEKNRAGVDTAEQIQTMINDLSYRQPIVQFYVGPKDIISFVHHCGASHSHKFADGTRILSELVARWRYLVECAPATGKSPRSADLRDERALLNRIGQWLLPPLEIPTEAEQLLIIPEGQLASLPWNSIANGHGPLIDNHQLTIAPSIRHHLAARAKRNHSSENHIFVGDINGLDHVAAEIKAVKRALGKQTTVLTECQRADWPTEGSYNIWHYTGHGQLRADNPFYSSLSLNDGPLFAADFRLMKNDVNLVTLAACRTGQQTSLPGEEATGLVRSLLEMGARNVVASGWAVSDISTSQWMKHIYSHYLSGQSVAQAIRQTSIRLREQYPSAYHWGAFTVFGAG